MNQLREQLADLAHRQWSGWLEYMLSKGTYNADGSWTMPPEFVQRWTRQMKTDYVNLSESEQNSDRTEADKFIAVFEKTGDDDEWAALWDN